MKETKQKFDSLIEKVRAGDSINFGQMEKVYAKGFLGKFLERLSSEPTKKKLNQVYRDLLEYDNLAETYLEEQGDEIELSGSQLNNYSLELIAMMSGVLGVRASTQQLSPFIENALRLRDWEFLEKVLSLSEEGKMGKGVIEKVALEQLAENKQSSYEELKKRFGEIKFDPEQVRDYYKTLIHKHSFDSVKSIKKETSIDVPQEYVQDLAEGIFHPVNAAVYQWQKKRTSFEVIKKAIECSAKRPELSEIIRKGLYRSFNIRLDIPEQDLEDCNTIFNLYSDRELAPEIQAALLDSGNIDLFEKLYQRSSAKINKEKIKNIYEGLEKVEGLGINHLEVITRAAITTGIAPNEEISNKVFSDLLKRKKFSDLQTLCERTNLSPSFDQGTVEEILRNYSEELRFIEFRNVARIIKRSKNNLKPEYLNQAAIKYLSLNGEYRNIKEAIKEVDSLYQEIGLEPSSDVTSAKIQGLMNSFILNFQAIEQKYSKEI